MFYRKYLAFFDAIHPWVTICCTTWWVDRLLVEFGHRVPDSEICDHSDLQYVKWHLAFTVVAVIAQTISATRRRSIQFKRECLLLGTTHSPRFSDCMFITQLPLCVFWCAAVVTTIDFSPWLCIPYVLHRRATFSLLSLLGVAASFLLDTQNYDWLLQRRLPAPPLVI
jgi:hypothetical protein